MMRGPVMLAFIASLSGTLPSAQAQEATLRTRAEADLAQLDARQKMMVASGDVAGLAALSSACLTINAPTNRVLTRDTFIAMMRSGQIGAEAFERSVERVTVSGGVGVVMGSEVFTPTAGSELGRSYGVRPLKRRYTNVYVREHGHWKWLARHANVVPRQPELP